MIEQVAWKLPSLMDVMWCIQSIHRCHGHGHVSGCCPTISFFLFLFFFFSAISPIIPAQLLLLFLVYRTFWFCFAVVFSCVLMLFNCVTRCDVSVCVCVTTPSGVNIYDTQHCSYWIMCELSLPLLLLFIYFHFLPNCLLIVPL